MSEIDALRETIASERGEGKTMRGDSIPSYNLIPTGVFLLDYATFGGIPDGRATTWFGVENSGKSMMVYSTIAQFQKKYPDNIAVLADLEQMYDPEWATLLGVDQERLEYLRPDHGQEAADMLLSYMDAWEVGLVALDSLASVVPMQLGDRSVEDFGVGERARIIGDMCSKMLLSWSRERKRDHWVTVMLVNQYRDKMGATKYEDPRKEPGGWQARYFPNCKVQMKRRDAIAKGATEPYGNLHTFTLTKAKGSSIKTGEFEVNLLPDHPHLKRGQVDEYKQIATLAKKEGVITGNPKSYVVEPWGIKFRTVDEIVSHMATKPDDLLTLKQHTLIAHRERYKLPGLPPDGYLLDWLSYE